MSSVSKLSNISKVSYVLYNMSKVSYVLNNMSKVSRYYASTCSEIRIR